MDSNTKKILIVGGVAAAGVAFWYFFFGPGATTAAAAGSPSATAAVPGSSAWNSPSNAAAVAEIQGWVAQNPPAQKTFFETYMPNATQTEISNLAAIIQIWNTPGMPIPTGLGNWWDSFTAAHGVA